MKNNGRVIVIGAGAAGMMAAYFAAAAGADVTVIEKNKKTGKKLRITGKGRCNVTNNCTPAEFMQSVPENGKFLYSAINRFTPADTMEFFENAGVPLKTERGRRVFPVSDNAHDIADALERQVRAAGVRILFGCPVRSVNYRDGVVSGVTAGTRDFPADAVIVCTGGASYPGTGSTGDGYAFAETAGLDVRPRIPSLIPIITRERVAGMSGLSLRNVKLTVTDGKKTVFDEMGEMLFTHTGLSGPLVLSASAHMRGDIASYTVHINLKPALDPQTLDARIISDLAKYSARDFANSLGDLLPRSLIPEIVRRSGIPPHKRSGEVSKAERRALLETLTDLTYTPVRFASIDQAIVTRGGVAVSELSPGKMSAKAVPGLYFAGEVIDVDAYTGGYNLQIAFATGKLAGEAAAEYAADVAGRADAAE